MIIYSIANIRELLNKLSFRNKYDMMANEISREIFQNVINGEENNGEENEFRKSYPLYNIEVSVDILRYETDYIEQSKNNFARFKINSYNEGEFNDLELKGIKIIMKIALAKGFSKEDYRAFHYRLYEISRHELEHRETYYTKGKPDLEYQELYNKLIEETNTRTLKEHCQIISQYILNPQEFPSYAKSLYYYSKKEKKDFRLVVQDILERSFYRNNPENINEAKNDSGIIQIFNATKEAIINEIKSLYPRSMYRMFNPML